MLDGPIDIVGDVHGEYGDPDNPDVPGLHALLARLGYDRHGRHPQDRHLVFVGDLCDRGPDSPAVVEWVRDRIAEGRAQCVLGNHELNALLVAEKLIGMKPDLHWLLDDSKPYYHRQQHVGQVKATGKRRDDILAFFRSLPLALERHGDVPVRVVHACWDAAMIERVRHRSDVIRVYSQEKQALDSSLAVCGEVPDRIRKLLHQNANAVKRLTSGLEGITTRPARQHGNELTYHEDRLRWWNDYHDSVLCVIGHYWRVNLPDDTTFEHLFAGLDLHRMHGAGPVMCIDYSAGRRFRERIDYEGSRNIFRTRMAALRLPEMRLYFDNAEPMDVLK
jgi:hypothetical protein